MTVQMLLANADSRELTQWQAYWRYKTEAEEQRRGDGKNLRGT